MEQKTKHPIGKSWLWPDHNIGKRESRRLREEHNATVNAYADLLAALRYLADVCDDSDLFDCNLDPNSDDNKALKSARAAIAKATG